MHHILILFPLIININSLFFSQGAKALLESGADPVNVGKIGQTPAQVAQSSNARDVIKVLQVGQCHDDDKCM